MRLAVVEFTSHDAGEEGGKPYSYVECRLIDPPIDFAVGMGVNVSEAFTDMQSRVLDTAIYSARLLHDDPDEWKRRSEQNANADSVAGADDGLCHNYDEDFDGEGCRQPRGHAGDCGPAQGTKVGRVRGFDGE